MVANLRTSGVADAVVSAPSAGDVLRFAAYVAELIGDDRIESVYYRTDRVSGSGTKKLFVTVTDTTHGETVAHLLGLDGRSDHKRENHEGFSCWEGKSGNVPVFLSAPLALGGMPLTRPWDWSASADALSTDKAVA